MCSFFYMKQLILIGVIIEIKSRFSVHHKNDNEYTHPCKISINTTLPYADIKKTELNHTIQYLLNIDKKIMNKLSLMKYDEKITHIKTYKPFRYNKSKNIIVTFDIPNNLSDVRGLSKLTTKNMYGIMVRIISYPQLYNFTDKIDKKKKIRGWKLKMKSIESI